MNERTIDWWSVSVMTYVYVDALIMMRMRRQCHRRI